MGVGPLSSSFPSLFRIIVNKVSRVKDCYVGDGVLCCAWCLLVNMRSQSLGPC